MTPNSKPFDDASETKEAIIYTYTFHKDNKNETQTQLENCRDYADSHHLTVVDEIVDELSDDVPFVVREGGKRILDLLAKGTINILIVYRVELLASADIDMFWELDDLLFKNIEIHSCDKGKINRHDILELILRSMYGDYENINNTVSPKSIFSNSMSQNLASDSYYEKSDADFDDEDDNDDESEHLFTLNHKANSSMIMGNLSHSMILNSPLSSSSLPENQIPILSRSEPLPHDGLFVRRNNSFGTRSVIGIKEMIENGVMIDQTNIRFDDFVLSTSDRIPNPDPGHAIAVSYGISPVQSNCKYHEYTTHFLEIALKSATEVPVAHPKNAPTPVNYVFVIDTSGSMSGEKLDSVKSSIREIFRSMSEGDVIGIIEFNTEVKTLLKATPKGKIDFDDFSKIIGILRADGGTDINLGLSYGIDETERYGQLASINHIYLFSDGNPTSGETDWIKIRQNIASKTRGNIGLSVFGFGSDANMRELDALAGVTGGQSAFVTHADDIHINLRDNLNRREYLVAINIQLKCEIHPDIKIFHLYGHDLVTDKATRDAVLQNVETEKRKALENFGVVSKPDIVTDEKGIRVFTPNLAIGETYWLVFELGIPPEVAIQDIGKATIQYVDTFARQSEKLELALSNSGTIPSDVAMLHALGLWTSEVAFYAIDDLYQNDRETAKNRISRHIQMLETARNFLPIPQINDDIISLRKFMSLSQNLGKPMRFSENMTGGAMGYAVYALSQFGQVRNGYMRNRYSA